MNNKISKKVLIGLIITLCIIFLAITTVNADLINADTYKPLGMEVDDIKAIGNVSGYIIRLIRNIGICVATVVLSALGLKYMLGSVEEKAEYKKSMLPYIVGCLLLVATFEILTLISSVSTEKVYYQSEPETSDGTVGDRRVDPKDTEQIEMTK